VSPVPVAVAGAVTIALIVVLGVFIFPALLRRPPGRWVVAIVTLALIVLFFMFERDSGLTGHPLVSGIVIGLAPLTAGLIVYRLQGGKRS
jgi:hypothetical protein